MSITLATRVRLSSDSLCRRVEDEMVLLQLTRSIYFSLDPVGARMFELMTEASSLAEALERVTAEFQVERATAEQDLLRLASELQAQELVVAETAAASGSG